MGLIQNQSIDFYGLQMVKIQICWNMMNDEINDLQIKKNLFK